MRYILQNIFSHVRAYVLYQKYREFTMMPKKIFLDNLMLATKYRHLVGPVVECGVWRGGMSGALAELLGTEHDYYLFDSFDGLPEATGIDGVDAINWQKDTASPLYFDNCKAEQEFAERAMIRSRATSYHIVKGWFKETVPATTIKGSIAILRLDGDWYESTMECLSSLYPPLQKGGLIIIDDYYAWDGATRAVHDYLSMNKLSDKIRQTPNGVAYIIKS